jgi:hypothetical protein
MAGTNGIDIIINIFLMMTDDDNCEQHHCYHCNHDHHHRIITAMLDPVPIHCFTPKVQQSMIFPVNTCTWFLEMVLTDCRGCR